MGRSAAELFAAEGARVVVSDVVDGSEVVDAIRTAGGHATFVRADVSRAEDCDAMVRAAIDTFGALHVLYNNAGIFPDDDGGVLDTPETTWQRVMEINLKGVWLGCRAGIPAMLASGGGSIVNVASFVALMGAATAQIAYTASKGGVLSMTRELAVEYGRQGIRANSLCPGPIETPLLAELLSDPGAPGSPPRAHPDGPARPSRRARPGRAVPCLRRLLVHDRRVVGRRRRHHRRVRHSRVIAARSRQDVHAQQRASLGRQP